MIGYVGVCICLLMSPLLTANARGQNTPSAPEPSDQQDLEAGFTLENWTRRQRLLVLDRSRNVGGRLYDRGIFRHVTPDMDREYALDMLVYRHTAEEIMSRSRSGNSLGLRVGSIGRDMFAVVSEINSHIPVGANHTIDVDAVLQQDVQAVRSFLELGYKWHPGSNHTVGVQHTVSEFKPDLDLSALYQYTGARVGTAEVILTLQNLYNDFIYKQLGISAGDREVIRSYRRRPYLMSFSYASPHRYSLRAEVVAGLQPPAIALFESQAAPEYRYRDEEQLHYLGALLEYRYASLVGGLFYKRDGSSLDRVGTGADVASDYAARQVFNRFGVFIEGGWWRLRGRIRAFTGSYRDQQRGSNYTESLIEQAVDYDERQRGLQMRLLYEPEEGFLSGLEYAAFQRSYEDNINILASTWTKEWWVLGPSNYRVVGLVGYRFPHGKIIAGAGYDLDGDPVAHEDLPPRRFDNGFGRLVLYW